MSTCAVAAQRSRKIASAMIALPCGLLSSSQIAKTSAARKPAPQTIADRAACECAWARSTATISSSAAAAEQRQRGREREPVDVRLEDHFGLQLNPIVDPSPPLFELTTTRSWAPPVQAMIVVPGFPAFGWACSYFCLRGVARSADTREPGAGRRRRREGEVAAEGVAADQVRARGEHEQAGDQRHDHRRARRPEVERGLADRGARPCRAARPRSGAACTSRASTIEPAPITAQAQPCWKTPARIRNSPAKFDRERHGERDHPDRHQRGRERGPAARHAAEQRELAGRGAPLDHPGEQEQRHAEIRPWLTIWSTAPSKPRSLPAKRPNVIRPIWASDE